MVQRSAGPALDDVLAAIADPTRRSIVERLSSGRASVSELAEPLPMSLAAVLKHVRVLEGAGLVRHRKEGRVRMCELHAERLALVEDWVSEYRRFWDRQLDSLAGHFEERGR